MRSEVDGYNKRATQLYHGITCKHHSRETLKSLGVSAVSPAAATTQQTRQVTMFQVARPTIRWKASNQISTHNMLAACSQATRLRIDGCGFTVWPKE
jgi:hypothetical protein